MADLLNSPNLVNGIRAAAEALGISPLDLATTISYETGGTFDGLKRGPTTQWGQHRGYIQFGEPQARKYGVDWNDPDGSQLGANGAVVKYLRDTGVKPGMGLLDVYSAINAGGVGRYNRSDANNGGAPGTVADKVNNQMGSHRANAEKLFGGANYNVADGPKGQEAYPAMPAEGSQIAMTDPNAVAPSTGQPAQTSLGSMLAGLGAAMPALPQQVEMPRQDNGAQIMPAMAQQLAEKGRSLKNGFMPDLDTILGLSRRPV